MQHYFIEKEHKSTDYFEFEDVVADMKLKFRSCDSIFSKNQVDEGTQTLLNTIFTKLELSGNGLDLGCGYGPIGLTLAYFNQNCQIDMFDINERAVELSKKNKEKLGLNNVAEKYIFRW